MTVVVVVIWGTPQFHLIIQIMSLFSICKLLYVVIHSFGGHQFLGVTFLDAYSTTGGMFISEETAKKNTKDEINKTKEVTDRLQRPFPPRSRQKFSRN